MSRALEVKVSHGLLDHVNQRKQGDEESKDLRVDLKLTIETPAQVLDMLMPNDERAAVDAFWTPDGEPYDFALSLGPISVEGTLPDHEVTLYRMKAKRTYKAEIKKVLFKIRDKHMVDLTFSAIGIVPKPGDLDILANMLQEHVDVEVTPPEELRDQGKLALSRMDDSE